MVRLPEAENQNILTVAPQTSLSEADIANPYKVWAGVFGKVGTMLSEHADEQAQIEGQNAVTIGDDGRLKVAPNRFSGHAADIYARETAVTLSAAQQSQLRRDTADAAAKSNGKVEEFDAWQKSYMPGFMKGVPQQTRNTFKLHAQDVLGQARAGVMAQGRERNARIAVNTQKARFGELQQDLLTLARQDGTSNKAYRDTLDQLQSLGAEMVGNPDMAYGQAEFDIDMKNLRSQVAGQMTIGHIDSVLEKEGVPAALREVNGLEKDASLSSMSLTDRRQLVASARQRISEFRAFKEVENQPLLAAKKDYGELFTQGRALGDSKVDELAAQLTKGGLPAEAQELLDQRDRFKAIAMLRDPNVPLSAVTAATKGAMRRADGDVPVVVGDAVGAGRVGQPDTGNVQPAVMSTFRSLQNSLGFSLPIMSGYRDPDRNAKAGGAKGSQHMDGNALDLDVRDKSPEERVAIINAASAAGFTGIGVENNTIHVDLGPRRAFGPDYHAGSIPAWAKGAVAEHLARAGGAAPSAARAQGMTRSMPGNVRASLSAAAQRYGQDPNALLTIAWLESRGRGDAQNPGSSAGGVLQFTDGTAAHYGLTNRFDVGQSADAGARLLRDNRAAMVKALGREPTVGELYLAHQQGAGGASKLLANLDAKAADIVGAAAVTQNGGRADMTAREFAQLWTNKADDVAGGGGVSAGAEPGGSPYGPSIDPDTVKGYRDALTDRMQIWADGIEGSMKQGYVPTGEQIATFAENAPLVTDDKLRERLTTMMQSSEFMQGIAAQYPAPADQRKYLAAMEASMRRDGADLATIRLHDAADAMVKREEADLKADPFAFARDHDPRVAAAWAAAGTDSATGKPNPMSPDQVRNAVAITAETQRRFGVTDPQLLPKDSVSAAATAFTTAETEAGSVPPDARMGPAASLILSTDDPNQRHAIFQQLVKAGVPEASEAAFDALARGDVGAARNLFMAATINAKDLPKTQDVKDDKIAEQLQTDVFAPGKLGNVVYGLSGGTGDTGKASRNNGLLTNAVKLRMVQGQSLADAVAGASKDLFGDLKVVDFHSRISKGALNVQVTAPTGVDQSTMLQGFDRLRPKVQAALQAQAERMNPSAGPKGPVPGQIEAGNIDLEARPVVKNADGTISTVRSMSFEEDGKEVLIPTVSPDGRVVTDNEAIVLYHQTGQFLGKFENADAADAYAGRLHESQERFYDARRNGSGALQGGVLGISTDNIVAKGVFRNAGDGFAFVNPYTNLAIAGEDGKPLIFTPDEVMNAATAPQNIAELGAQVGAMVPPAPAGSPSSPFQPDANMGIRDALMGGPEQAQADLAAAAGTPGAAPAPMPTAARDVVDAAPAPPSLDAWTSDQPYPDFSRYSPEQIEGFIQKQNRILDGLGR